MRYKLVIDCVDQTTTLGFQSRDPKEVLDYLEKNDHEGSSLSLICPDGRELWNNEAVYAALRERL